MEIEFNVTKDNVIPKLLDLSNTYSQITININDFVTILYASKKENYEKFIPITSREILVSGLYGTINNMKIMVRKNIRPGYAQVEEENNGK